jgi:hypothetical protein
MRLDDPILVIVLLVLLSLAIYPAIAYWGERRWMEVASVAAATLLLLTAIDEDLGELRLLTGAWALAFLIRIARIRRLTWSDYAYPLPAEIRQVDVDEWNRFIHERTGPRASGRVGVEKDQTQSAERPSVLLEAMKGLEGIKEEQRDAIITMTKAMMAVEFRKQHKAAVRLEIWSNAGFGALFLVLGVILSDPLKEFYQRLMSAIS